MKKLIHILTVSILAPLLPCQVERDAGPPNGVDDTGKLQNALNTGGHLLLRPGLTYHISQRLVIPQSNSGIICRGAPATLRMLAAFDNPDGAHMFRPTPIANAIGLHANGVQNLRFENFKLEKIHVDGSYVAGIWLESVTNAVLEDLDMWGFSLGPIVAVDTCNHISIRDCVIHDSWASIASTDPAIRKFPQLTGIIIDDNKVSVGSSDIVVANNTIRKLRLKRSLYEMPRSAYAPSMTGTVGFQTDGITAVVDGNGFQFVDNVFDVLGEGLDLMTNNSVVAGNRISNIYEYGLKLVHGASNIVSQENEIRVTGLGAISVGGSSESTFKHTFFNFCQRNTCSGFAQTPAFAQGMADTGFDVPAIAYSGGSEIPAAYWVTPNGGVKKPRANFFLGNKTNYYSPADQHLNYLIWIGATCEDIQFLSDAVNANLNTHIDSNAVANGCAILPDNVSGGPLTAVRGDFDNNGLEDMFVLRKFSGQNTLYRQMPNQVCLKTANVIDPLWINGTPDVLRCGDFNGDGKDDLFWSWGYDGTNRVAYGNATAFDQVSFNLIAPTAINMSPDDILVANFDGGGDDILFVWRQSGMNRLCSGTATGFTRFDDPIAPGGINGTADHVVVGNFDGLVGDDVLFHWNASGNNRFLFGTGTGSFTSVANPIPVNEVRGTCDVRSFDADFDGRKDVNFFSRSHDQRRLYLGQANRTFLPD